MTLASLIVCEVFRETLPNTRGRTSRAWRCTEFQPVRPSRPIRSCILCTHSQLMVAPKDSCFLGSRCKPPP